MDKIISNQKTQKYFLWGLFLFSLMRGFKELNRWNYTHFLFDYEFGFVKRGIIGEFFRILNISRGFGFIDIISIGVSVLFALVFFHFISGKKRNHFYFIALALTSSATIQHFAYDRARYDIIMYLLTFIGLYFNRHKCSPFLVTLILILNLFIHEASFFFICPILIFLNFDSHKKLKILLAQVAIVILCTFCIGRYGGFDVMSFENHVKFLKERFPETAISSVAVLHSISLAENMDQTFQISFSKGRIFHHIYLFIYLIPYFILSRRFLKKGIADNRRKIAFILCFSPLALYPVAFDHFRWWSLSILNCFLVAGYFLREDSSFQEQFNRFIENNLKVIKLIIFLSIALGPIKVTTCFY